MQKLNVEITVVTKSNRLLAGAFIGFLATAGGFLHALGSPTSSWASWFAGLMLGVGFTSLAIFLGQVGNPREPLMFGLITMLTLSLCLGIGTLFLFGLKGATEFNSLLFWAGICEAGFLLLLAKEAWNW